MAFTAIRKVRGANKQRSKAVELIGDTNQRERNAFDRGVDAHAAGLVEASKAVDPA